MESGNPLKHWLAAVIMAVPPVYLLLRWNNIPGTVALHFGADGTPDRYGSKVELLITTLLMAIISLLCYLLITNVHKLDKKRTKGIKPPMLDNIAFVTAVFVSVLSLAIIISGVNPGAMLIDKIVLPAIGLFFIFMGNVMYNIRPNRFVGIRTPWTLSSDDNWKKTHRLGAKLFFVGGLLITLTSLTFDTVIATIFTTGIALLIAVITITYSFLYYKSNKNHNVL